MSDIEAAAVGSQQVPLVEQPVMVCPTCHASADIWAEDCACGTPLLADTRKIRWSSAGGEPQHRLERRAKSLEESTDPAGMEQAVRDLAVLRSVDEAHAGTDRIARLLLRLGRVDEAVAEAQALYAQQSLPADIVVSLSRAYQAAGDIGGANAWLDTGLGLCSDDLKSGIVPLVCERARLLIDEGRAPEALALLDPLSAQLDEAIKRTEKSGGAAAANLLIGGDTRAYAISYWSGETKSVREEADRAKAQIKAGDRARKAAEKAERAAQRAADGKTHWWQ